MAGSQERNERLQEAGLALSSEFELPAILQGCLGRGAVVADDGQPSALLIVPGSLLKMADPARTVVAVIARNLAGSEPSWQLAGDPTSQDGNGQRATVLILVGWGDC